MSWLNDLIYEWKWVCKDGHFNMIRAKERPEDPFCEFCGGATEYTGFNPQKIGTKLVTTYEKHGRKAVRIRNKDGSLTHLSETKRIYQKTGRIESQYTKGYQEAQAKEEEKQKAREKAINENHSTRRQSMDHYFKQMVKELPDGEYTSDGFSAKETKKQ